MTQRDGCPLYCKYCGAKLRLDPVGHYCPTKNCQWHHGVKDCPIREPGLFDRARAYEEGEKGKRRNAAKHEPEILACIPVAIALGHRFGARGVTISDLRVELKMGPGKDKELSWLGVVFKRAGFVSTGQRRRSIVVCTHGIANLVWVLPEYLAAFRQANP